MQREQCRLCLHKDMLTPIFEDLGQDENYSSVLALTTGLSIMRNDGLPQQICVTCKEHVQIALNLRNKSQLSEKLLNLRCQNEDMVHNPVSTISNSWSRDHEFETGIKNLEDSTTNCYDIEGFKIEIELGRLTQDGGDESQDGGVIQDGDQKKAKTKGLSVKEKRKMYMALVEGEFDPNGPVQCKVCKATVSKWACFVNHAKKHLGFKFMCEFCGKSFISTNQLKRHCRSYHGLERELKCQHCSFLALDKAQLVIHERRAHTGERPFVCDSCAAAYFSRKCLLQHLESHAIGATVQCDACPAVLKSRRHLAKHRYSVHGVKRRAKAAAERANRGKQ